VKDAGRAHDRRDARGVYWLNVSSAPADSIAADVPLAFWNKGDVITGKCNKETRAGAKILCDAGQAGSLSRH
jgi:hypothetical protein